MRAEQPSGNGDAIGSAAPFQPNRVSTDGAMSGGQNPSQVTESRPQSRSTPEQLAPLMRKPGTSGAVKTPKRTIDARHELVEQVLAYISKHLNEPLSPDLLANAASVSRATLDRDFLVVTGHTPPNAIRKLRAERAREQVEAGSESFETVARSVGFSGSRQMLDAFHQIFGKRPEVLRQAANVSKATRFRNERVQQMLNHISDNLRQPLNMDQLIAAGLTSIRQHNRNFRAVTGHSPQRVIERLRIEMVRPQIELGLDAFETIARAAGFSNEDSIRIACVRVTGETPDALRRAAQSADGPRIRSDHINRALNYIVEHLHESLSVSQLAEALEIDRKRFFHDFSTEIGQPPADFIQRLRVDRAKSQIEAGLDAFEMIAPRVGFSDVEQMHNAFVRVLGETPLALWQKKQTTRRIDLALDFISKNLDQSITMEQLAELVGVSRSHFTKIFITEIGRHPAEYIRELRAKNARQQGEK